MTPLEMPQGAMQQEQQEQPPPDQGVRQVLDEKSMQEYPPEKKRKLEMANAMITDMMYNPATKTEVASMLKQAPPKQAIPVVVNTLFMKFEDMMKQKSGELPLDIKLAAGVHAFSEVMEMAEAQGLVPKDIGEAEIQPMLKDTMQQYIQAGLKDGSIDPIELQQQIEPLLSDEEREIGLQFAGATQTPDGLQQGQVNMGMQNKAQRPLEVKNKNLQKQNVQMSGALQGIANQPTEEG